MSEAVLAHEGMIAEKVRGKLVPSKDGESKGDDLIMEEEQSVSGVKFLLRLLKL